jgi:hypothetical protein
LGFRPVYSGGSLKVPVPMLVRRALLGVMATAVLSPGCSSFDPVWLTLSGEDAVETGEPATTPGAPSPRLSATELASNRRPLMIIRFDRPDVSYEEALHSAVRLALARRPDVAFDLVAVAPQAGNPAQITLNSEASKRYAENVFRSLTAMGLAADRVSLSATTNAIAQSDEVWLYLR